MGRRQRIEQLRILTDPLQNATRRMRRQAKDLIEQLQQAAPIKPKAKHPNSARMLKQPKQPPKSGRQTRKASLTRAAKEWFKMDRRTLIKGIDDGNCAAQQVTPNAWVFDIDEINDVNPHADCEPRD